MGGSLSLRGLFLFIYFLFKFNEYKLALSHVAYGCEVCVCTLYVLYCCILLHTVLSDCIDTTGELHHSKIILVIGN